ncbi:hypothetical protein ACLBXM_15780 [Xanthobacteraceae bacterium A53D]
MSALHEGAPSAPPADALGRFAMLSHEDGMVAQSCSELAAVLNLAEPVSVEVLRAAVENEAYAQRLLASRRNAAALGFLLKHPPRRETPAAERSNGELIRGAAQALLRWGKTGFAIVDAETLARRRSACLACPNLTDPPDTALYRIAAYGDERKICGACGCVVWSKTRLPTEACPVALPGNERLNRWGEPRQLAVSAEQDIPG